MEDTQETNKADTRMKTAEILKGDPVMTRIKDEARARYAEARRQAETGLTDEQAQNIALMNALNEKYPLAFDKTVSPDGREIWKVKMAAVTTFTSSNDWFFTQEGIFGIHSACGSIRRFEIRKNPTSLLSFVDELKEKGNRSRTTPGITLYADEGQTQQIIELNITQSSPATRERLGDILTEAQRLGEQEEQKIKKADLSKILDDITGAGK